MRVAVLAAALVSVLALGSAQGEDIGWREYVNSCAVCHGDSGRGDGPIVASLKIAPADLTKIQKSNNGVFPFGQVWLLTVGK
jgi:mono/diheme cytochrome c family protein